MPNKTKLKAFRLTEDEWNKLNENASKLGISASQHLRTLIHLDTVFGWDIAVKGNDYTPLPKSKN